MARVILVGGLSVARRWDQKRFLSWEICWVRDRFRWASCSKLVMNVVGLESVASDRCARLWQGCSVGLEGGLEEARATQGQGSHSGRLGRVHRSHSGAARVGRLVLSSSEPGFLRDFSGKSVAFRAPYLTCTSKHFLLAVLSFERLISLHRRTTVVGAKPRHLGPFQQRL